jgi:hypothetical protein
MMAGITAAQRQDLGSEIRPGAGFGAARLRPAGETLAGVRGYRSLGRHGSDRGAPQ